MIIKYENVVLTELGDVSISQEREYEGGEAPQRAKVKLKVSVALFERTWNDNNSLLQQLAQGVRKQHGRFFWSDPETARLYLNQTVAVDSQDRPEEWGQYHQQINLVFSYFEQDLVTQNLPLFFKRTGSNTNITFTNVARFVESASAQRFHTLRALRKEMQGRVAVTGFIPADTTVALSARRDALRQQLGLYREQMNGAEGTLQFGESGKLAFDRRVKIEEFTADVDQMVNVINFSFTASYTLFPDETDYATVEYEAAQRDGMTGEEFLSLTGKIQAPTEAAARAKLAALVPVVLAQYGYKELSADYPAIQQLKLDTSAGNCSSADGAAFTELSFAGEWRRWRKSNQAATFKKTSGTGAAVALPNVRVAMFRYSARRFNEHRSQRQHAGGAVEMAGTIAADPTLPLPQRRTALLAAKDALLAEVNGADGTLTHGDWSQVVRVDDFRAEVNQAETGVEWALSASYTLFPNEAGYATATFSVQIGDDAESGDETMAFSGRIEAQTGAAARVKLDALRTSMFAIYGFAVSQRIRGQTALAGISANGDRTAGLQEGMENATAEDYSALELTFSEDYRRRKQNVISYNLQISSREDVPSNTTLTTYAGNVTATTYAAAMSKAQALGDGKATSIGNNAFLLSSQLTQDSRQMRSDGVVEFVRLSFSYEYRSRLATGRAYLEVNSTVAKDTFGADTESVSGYVTAADTAAATALYLSEVRNAYGSALVRNESTTASVAKAQAGVSFTTQQMRLDFSFQVHRAKQGPVAIRYSINVTKDFMSCTRNTSLQGSVFAATRDAAETALDGLITTLALGAPLTDSRKQDKDHVAGLTGDDALPGVFMKLDFDLSFRSKLTGVNGLLNMELVEEVNYSGTRWAVQDVPNTGNDPDSGVSIPQPAGEVPGSRTVRGSVTAATRATGEAWAKNHRTLLTGDSRGKRYPLPESWSYAYEIVPRTAGLISGTNPDITVVRVSFTFSEILPKYPAP